jgi:hypothetical protein
MITQGARKCMFTNDKPISGEATTDGSNLAPFRRPSRRRPRHRLVTPAKEGLSRVEAKVLLFAGANGATNNGSRHGDVNRHFAHESHSIAVKTIPGNVVQGDEIRLTLMEAILTTLLFLSPLTAPGLVWLMLHTAS